MRAFPPLPVREDWMPSYLARRGDLNRDFAYRLVDGQGAPSGDGRKYHSAVDWFAPAKTPVRAPTAGRVIRAERSSDHTGPVFGGVMAVEEPTGLCWVMRHVQPRLAVGAEVDGGQEIADVFDWHGGGDHLHLEIWKSAQGGYRHENMLDPKGVEWAAAPESPPAIFYFEELPAAAGGAGPDAVGVYERVASARRAVASRARRGEECSVMHCEDGLHRILRWRPGTLGRRFRFGPWAVEGERERVAGAREANTGRELRRFRGRAVSAYPWPRLEA